jgi:glycogen(starch) synthase
MKHDIARVAPAADDHAGADGAVTRSAVPRISVVINTFNRANSLRQTLDGLTLLDFPNFEVVVVNGPSTDGTDDVLRAWAGRIKVLTTPERNLSMSRNLGIAGAAGDIVAFIDDDAYPDPAWLDRLAAAYTDDEAAGAGGPVYDHTGYNFQIFYNIGNRFGTSWTGWPAGHDPTPVLNRPYSNAFPSLLGANSSFRRDRLVEIGGFDEEFEYYLDETDVCVRLVDSGYIIRLLDDAFVYHKFLPSHLRTERRALRDRYAVIKNRLYFAMKHALVMTSFYEVIQDVLAFIEEQRQDYRWNVEQGHLSEADFQRFEADVHRAFDTGLARIREGAGRYRSAQWFASHQRPFLPFPTRLAAVEKLHLCFFSQEYPPGAVGGIGRFTRELAVGLAELGHHVHVLTRGEDHHRVDLEDGVWVHRIVPEYRDLPATPNVPRSIWEYSASLNEELLRIHRHRPVDLVELPLWDSEGIASILDGTVPTVVSLHTPLPAALAISPHWTADAQHHERHIRPLLALEPFCLDRCDFIRANSDAVIEEVERGHGIRLDRTKLGVVPHGFGAPVAPAPPRERRPPPANSEGGHTIEVLFVGRLERRKGIDLLLGAVPMLLASDASVRFTIVGDDSIPGPHGRGYRQEFETTHADIVERGTVRFLGKVSDAQLDQCYAECDIFVAPSRYESFGLILVEAMRHGKAVVACDIGGMREVVTNGETGLLVRPEDTEALATAIGALAADKELRARLGQRAIESYTTTFTRAATARRALRFYRDILGRSRASERPRAPRAEPELVGSP